MFDAAADTSKPAVPAESSARERMGILRRMSEIGLRMAERLDRQSEIAALKAEGSVVPEAERVDCARRVGETTRAFAQVSRAVSVCIALEERIERGPPIPDQPQGGRPFGLELVCAVPRESRLKTRRDEVQAGVRDAIDAYAPINPARVGDLCRRLDDLLDREVAAVDIFLTRPTDETIARLCTRLGLEPPGSAPGNATGSAGFQPAMRAGRPHSGNGDLRGEQEGETPTRSAGFQPAMRARRPHSGNGDLRGEQEGETPTRSAGFQPAMRARRPHSGNDAPRGEQEGETPTRSAGFQPAMRAGCPHSQKGGRRVAPRLRPPTPPP